MAEVVGISDTRTKSERTTLDNERALNTHKINGNNAHRNSHDKNTLRSLLFDQKRP